MYQVTQLGLGKLFILFNSINSHGKIILKGQNALC